MDAALVSDLRAEVLAGLSGHERSLQEAGRPPLETADEQALGRQLIAEAMERRARAAVTSGQAVMSP